MWGDEPRGRDVLCWTSVSRYSKLPGNNDRLLKAKEVSCATNWRGQAGEKPEDAVRAGNVTARGEAWTAQEISLEQITLPMPTLRHVSYKLLWALGRAGNALNGTGQCRMTCSKMPETVFLSSKTFSAAAEQGYTLKTNQQEWYTSSSMECDGQC